MQKPREHIEKHANASFDDLTLGVMRIAIAIGVFFLVLGVIFGFAARSEYRAAHGCWNPAGIARRRIAVIFSIVGLALIIWQIT